MNASFRMADRMNGRASGKFKPNGHIFWHVIMISKNRKILFGNMLVALTPDAFSENGTVA
jgi:hypothetical protein